MLGDPRDTRTPTKTPDSRTAPPATPLPPARRLVRGDARAALTFAGQGVDWWTTLASVRAAGASASGERWAGAWLALAQRAIDAVVSSQEARWSGLYAGGTDLTKLTDAAVGSNTEMSFPLIFLAQMIELRRLSRRGLTAAFLEGRVPAVTGYSQGLAAALATAETLDGQLSDERMGQWLELVARIGFEAARASFSWTSGATSPMAVVVGPDRPTLQSVLSALGRDDLAVALHNDLKRHVVSGSPAGLAALRQALEARAAKDVAERQAGRHGGRVLTVGWEEVQTTAAFHSPAMQAARDNVMAWARERGMTLPPVRTRLVFDPATRAPIGADALAAMVDAILVAPGFWQETLIAMNAAAPFQMVLDIGPETGIARLSAGILRGSGVEVFPLGDELERERFFTATDRDLPGRAPATVRYEDFAPKLARLPDGHVVVDNRFSRATGLPPVILPGMTPTTVDVPIVAAAANAGFMAELAGGGQVSKAIFEARIAELEEVLAPGVDIVFNALLLDAYLWGLHLGDAKLVQKAAAHGAPLAGVTVSAGIPPTDQAVGLLDDLARLGVRWNAFKPGTKAQIEQVVAIARAAPHHTIFMHVEGGKAGGHHSWEDLDQLLLDTYHAVRAEPNLVLCVGGGIADEARGVALLSGAWSTRYGLVPMPVDAIFLGTLAMAAAEATANPDVKAALAHADGTDSWVGRGEARGGVTSGRSQLDADIHYLENAAARCGRLLDEVAGDAAQVAARRDEIIAALAQTAKPYFGDLETMTWAALLSRLVELLAVTSPKPSRYEDGPFADVTWRTRVLDVIRRAEARLAGLRGVAAPIESIVQSAAELDDPKAALERLFKAYPEAESVRVLPPDATWFVREVCARPGKPVPFVPILDQDVRRWFKSDSLWQAQDPRYAADQVLVIPGPEAVRGIRTANEPVSVLLSRFDRALVAHLEAAGRVPTPVEDLRPRSDKAGPPTGFELTHDGSRTTLRCTSANAASDWPQWVGLRYAGPLAALVAAPTVVDHHRVPSPLVRLLAPVPGAVATLYTDGTDRLVGLTYDVGRGELLELEVSGDELTLALRHPSVHRTHSQTSQTSQSGPLFQMAFRAVRRGAHPVFVALGAGLDQAVSDYYARVLFAERPTPVALHAWASERATMPSDRAAAYARVTGAMSAEHGAPDPVFSLAWPAIYRTLACRELGSGLLRLVHLDNVVERDSACNTWPEPGQTYEVRARVTHVEDHADSRVVTVVAHIAESWHLRSTFHIRGDYRDSDGARSTEEERLSLVPADAATLRVLRAHCDVTFTTDPAVGADLTIDVALSERTTPTSTKHHARGTIRQRGEIIGTIAHDSAERVKAHPIAALLDTLEPTSAARPTPRKTLAETTAKAPPSMVAFADIGGDHNPIHTSALAARLAGLHAPIVHGMWTSARLHAFVADALASGDPSRLVATHTRFLAPLEPGEDIVLSVVRTGFDRGDQRVEATASARRGEALVPVAKTEVRLEAKRTAYLFPGQGIQQPGMGQAAAQRSPAARAVWQKAEAICRDRLGFSLLRVVNENPTSLLIHGERFSHPQGVLHLTQLTQVAMAVLAQAQVAELEEAGAWAPDYLFAGHSVGEYNALAAAAKVLPLEAVIEVVYRRGSVMHGLVPRDAEGRSKYAMGVIRPQLARLDHAGAETLVRSVAQASGAFLEIVNYNVRGRQYAVTGDGQALDALAKALAARQRPGDKPAFLLVPGIDVPFHSSALKGGVASFRASLDRHLPGTIAADRLVGRYVPNLVARPFALDAEFITAVRDAVGEPSRSLLDAVLRDEGGLRSPAQRDRLARTLLVELLAWQFASPVRWIETQELLFTPRSAGGLAAERVIEIGVGYQPTVANMARQTREAMRATIEILNVEAERALVFGEDESPTPAQPVTSDSVAPAASPKATEPVAVAAGPAIVLTATRPSDIALSHGEALSTLLALQAKVRLDQIGPAETIDGLFDGVSSRRNQVLLDLGAEFDAGTIDRAHELPVSELAAEVKKRAPAWRGPGSYLQKAHDEALKKAFARSGLTVSDAKAHLEATFGFGPGLIAATFDTLALEHRTGDSVRGGPLGSQAEVPATKDNARAMLDRVVEALGKRRQTTFGKLGAGPSVGAAAAVDPAALMALEQKLFGPDGALTRAAEALRPTIHMDAPAANDDGHLAALEAELGSDILELVRPRFDARRQVAFTSSWASAHRDLVRACYGAMNGSSTAQLSRELERLAPHTNHPRLRLTARWFERLAEDRGLTTVESLLGAFADRPSSTLPFSGKTALVTGAGPGSIASAIVGRLLAGGARVVVTTSQAARDRIAAFRDTYERHAAPGAELHIVPFNQASLGDVDALVAWLLPKFTPDFVIPFAALKDYGTADELGMKAMVAFRAMVLATERLVGRLGRAAIQAGENRRCHVLLPLSPNHGAFGGDGAYAETKAALEVMLAKWTSEAATWGRGTTLVGARIGWVRGTGLMAGNDKVAPRLEATTGIRTFSTDEMADSLVGLLDAAHCAAALERPLLIDLTGGFDRVPDLKAAVDAVRVALEADETEKRAAAALEVKISERIGRKAHARATVTPLPDWPVGASPDPDWQIAWPGHVTTQLSDMVCIVGFGEVGPGGTSRTRFDLELARGRDDGKLAPPAVLELAWLMGLVRWQETGRGGGWIDVETQESVPEGEIAARYHDRVRQGLGIRFTEPAVTGFDPERSPVLEKVYLERDFTFRVGSETEARAFRDAAPESTHIRADGDTWSVTRLAGTEIRVPRTTRLSRRVAGQLPTGFSLARYGFPGEMLGNVDPVALMNVAATVESFVSAGTTPEELLRWVHPARIGNTQGSGMGGMRSLQRLYVDHLLGTERQSDVLQETLINVVFAYATSTWVGSYGPMAHPVAACATAALSIEDACDKIRCDKADIIMAGGWDDLSAEGVIGFGDMNATAETDAMLAMGLEPDQMSRANDKRRKGFVEAQGGGALLLARGDVALALGLPVYGVVAYAASFGDGINRSIPAPGIGSLAAAVGGKRSPLARALAGLGLGADDIGVVSKHDTSTGANDPNESGIHQELQKALGRTPGNPLLVVSQKAVLGHAKGGAAAWQAIGLCQTLASGAVPPNPNLECVDPQLEAHDHLVYSSKTITAGPACPLRAGLLTSLGFGHVSALVCIAHPAAFLQAIPAEARAAWLAHQSERKATAKARLTRVMMGREPLYAKVGERRFAADDGTEAQRREETLMLLDPDARFDPTIGRFTCPNPPGSLRSPPPFAALAARGGRPDGGGAS